MNDATILISEESICLIAPLQAQLIQDTNEDSIGVINGPGDDKASHQWGPQQEIR